MESYKKKVGLHVKKKIQKNAIFLKFTLDMYVGNLYLLKSSPGANMEQIPGITKAKDFNS